MMKRNVASRVLAATLIGGLALGWLTVQPAAAQSLADLDTSLKLVPKSAAFNGVCSIGVRFNPDEYPGTDSVEVSQNPDGTWTVRAQPPNVVAVCINLDDSNPPTYYHMPFELTVEKK